MAHRSQVCTCAGCEWFEPRDGTCRYKAPDAMPGVEATFPRVGRTDWCRHFKTRDENLFEIESTDVEE